jgi:glucokinase
MYKIGIDIGGTNTEIGWVDPQGSIVYHTVMPTCKHADFSDYVQEIAEIVLNCQKQFAPIEGIGVGAPNGNAYTGRIEYAPNLPWKGLLELKKILQEATNLPVSVSNDANAAAMGEKLYGGAKNMSDFIVITLGTGVGSGIFSNGQLLYGHDSFAGEIGHVITFPNGRLCGCGRRGCIEAYASASGILKTFHELASKAKEIFTQIETIKQTKDIFLLAQQGNEIAIQTFDETAQKLALCLANSIAHTSPEAIFIFGGVAKADAFLLQPLQKYVDAFVLHNYRGKVKILRSQLSESDVAILGAAALI